MKKILSYFPEIHLSAIVISLLILPISLLISCASIGNPSGGPRDEDPPRFVKATPAPGAKNVSAKRIIIEFDELVNVKDAFTNVIISPVGAKIPKVTSQGRRILVDFQEDLLPNTTYTIDFGNSIEDNNEGNKLEGFSYTFSTGNDLDTLRASGIVLGAADLEPRPGLIVGVYSNLNDTAFQKTKPERIARTNDRGQFVVRGLKPGSYRIFAVADADADYHYANPDEELAFFSDIIIPSTEATTTTDTLKNFLTGQVDTIVKRARTRYLPNNLLLRSFVGTRAKQYLKEYHRVDSTRLQFIFNARQQSLPTFSLLTPDMPFNYAIEHSTHNDSITLWLRGKELLTTDTLQLAVRYTDNSSGDSIVEKSDTLKLITPRPRKLQKNNSQKSLSRSKKPQPEKTTPQNLGFRVVNSSSPEVYQPITIEFDTPLVALNKNKFQLNFKEAGDTLWRPTGVQVDPQPAGDGKLRQFLISPPADNKGKLWQYATDYQLSVDTLAATGIYGLETAPLNYEFKTKGEEDYCSLTLRITGMDNSTPTFVELLNASDNPVRKEKVIDNIARFNFLAPGKYYARIIEDYNDNCQYDAGDYSIQLQPEVAYYYPKAINIKKNWDMEESWNPFETAVDLQKPAAIKKNKPEADKRKKLTDTTEEESDEPFDPNANPFDPNDKQRRNKKNRLR